MFRENLMSFYVNPHFKVIHMILYLKNISDFTLPAILS